MCLISITDTSLAIISKWHFANEISKRKFVRGNPFKNKASVHMRTPKFFEAYSKIKAFVKPWWLSTFS